MNHSEEYLQQLAEMNSAPTVEPGEQGSPEWLVARLGKVTASNFKHVMDFTIKGKPTAKRDTYMWDVIVERITGRPAEHFVNAAMEHGTETEPLARMAYEARTGSIVAETGFLSHPTIVGVGGSPDGLVDDDGMIEIKCPTSRTHCELLLSADVGDYVPQIQGLLWITGRQWADFICFDNRLPDGLQLYIQRIERDDDYIAELAGNVIQFLAEVDEMHARVLEMKSPPKWS